MLSFAAYFETMARSKQYNEQEVIEKAMALFWRNGFEATSVRMLEKEMGINQFSIYASFGNKHGVFLESLKCYRQKIKCITDKLRASANGKEGIKQFFYDSIDFSMEGNCNKGCLITNTANELGEHGDPVILAEVRNFTNEIKELFKRNLQQDAHKDPETLEKEANYLLIAKLGFANASKVFSKKQLDDFIEITFRNI